MSARVDISRRARDRVWARAMRARVARCALAVACACAVMMMTQSVRAHAHHGRHGAGASLGHHHHHHHRQRRHEQSWSARDVVEAIAASTCVSGASLVAIAVIAMRWIGVRVPARWVRDGAVGAMLGDALGRQLPSAFEAAPEDAFGVGVACVLGVLVFSHLDGAIRARGKGTTEAGGARARASARATRPTTRATRARDAFAIERGAIAPSGWLNLFADAMHNATDGVIVAVAFARRGRAAGWSTARAALAHELPQEIGDYGILRLAGFSDAQALGFNLLSALVAVASTAATFALLAAAPAAAVAPPRLALLESACAGGFLFVAFASLLDDHVATRDLAASIRILVGAALACRL